MFRIHEKREAAMQRRRRTRHLLAAIGAVLLVAAPALAQQPTQAQANALRQSCRGDYQSHCASVPTGGSAALACLQQNASSLSAPCQQALAAVGSNSTQPNAPGGPQASAPAPGIPQPSPPLRPRQQMAVLRADCGPDYRRFCSGVPFGGGRALACLKANGPSLAPQCQSALLAMKQAR